MRTTVLMFLFIFCSFFKIMAFEATDTFRVSDNYFRYTYDNDFFNATDRYYTQGVRLELIHSKLKKNPLAKLLFSLNRQAINYYGLAFERDGFTPRSIRHDSIYYNERPYAGVSLLSSLLISIDPSKHQKLSSMIDFGVIGPLSLGAEEQKYIHRQLNNIQPLGWQYQIANDAVINYNVLFEKGLMNSKIAEFNGLFEARAGTLYDDIGIGSMVRVGRMNNYYSDPGISRSAGQKKFQCYFFLKGKAKVVGYNATLQGGVFNKGSAYTLHPSDIRRIVGTAAGGLVLAYKRCSVEYTRVFISPEFKYGISHGWGHCYICVCF